MFKDPLLNHVVLADDDRPQLLAVRRNPQKRAWMFR